MLIDLSEFRFYIRPGITDLRKAINGLTILVQNEMKNDPFSKSLFMFSNRQRKILKIVYWDKNGFCLWQKKLEKQKFPWPSTEQEAQEISYEELKLLLSGIDFFKAHKELSYAREALLKGKLIYTKDKDRVDLNRANLLGMYLQYNSDRQEVVNAYRAG